MNKSLPEIEDHALAALRSTVDEATAVIAARNCAWLHGAGYNGLKYLAEALQDSSQEIILEVDALGLDLKNVSCVFIAHQVEAVLANHGRLFLRNVRHGLYLLPASVTGNYGIGCPVDPGFALGGERTKNPYAEKMDLAVAQGVEVDDALWHSVAAAR
jgi:hypothetical protein